MKFFNFLHSTRVSKQGLLDIALLLSLLPHLFTLKFPMLVYLFLALVFILKKKNSKAVLIGFSLLGIIAITLSFFAEYNFSNFSRLLVFVSAISSFLIYAVVLQRLTRTINFYLLISPALLMVLSFFFFNSIPMLFYALFTLFSFTFIILYARMQSSIGNVLRINGLLYLFCLPIVVLLFISFPRISYKKASFGFKAEAIKRTGHDGTMHLDSKALLVPSSKTVMEVSFENEVPQNSFLYFRGSTLYENKGSRWVQGERMVSVKSEARQLDKIINYRVKLYAHLKKWLYMLDIPLLKPKDGFINQDFIAQSYKPIADTFTYEARSALSYRLETEYKDELEQALQVNRDSDPRTVQALSEAIDPQAEDSVKAGQLLAFFSSRDLSYSLKPKPIDLEHPLDSFLYDSKIGYCVHFASAFATSARIIGLPSRIVTGYKADRSNAINNYLLVKEADAHAWVELYLKGRGWVRFEPTSTAKRILTPDNAELSNSYTQASMKLTFYQKLFKQVNIYYMYSRYVINNWVLQYSRIKQMSLLKELLSNTLFLLKFIGSILGVILFSIVLFNVLQRRRCEDPILCEMNVLAQVLREKGFVRTQGETMFDFLNRVKLNDEHRRKLNAINELYHRQRYSQDQDKGILTDLSAEILELKKDLKNG